MTAPVRIFISYARKDLEHLEALETHLANLKRQKRIEVWTDQKLRPSTEWEPELLHHLQNAEIVLILISPDMMASDFIHDRELQEILDRQKRGELRVVPVLVRPTDLLGHALSSFQGLPRGFKPVVEWSNRDAAWLDVVTSLRLLIDELRSPPLAARGTIALSSEPLVQRKGLDSPSYLSPGSPKEIRAIGEIFRTAGPPPVTFVEPSQLVYLRAHLRVMGQGLVVEGPSGVGKTTLVKRAVEELRSDARAPAVEWIIASAPSQRQKIEARLMHGFEGILVLDDFHRLDPPLQAQVANAMKVLADQEQRRAKLVLIGINPVGDSLVSTLYELAGRFEVIGMGRQPDDKIDELIRKGEDAANIRFWSRAELVIASSGSLYTAQQLCQQACLRAQIFETVSEGPIEVKVPVEEVIRKVVDNLRPKYFALVRRFACHDDQVPPRGAALALLWLLSQSEEGHASLDDVHYRYTTSALRAAVALLKSSFLTRCFSDAPELKSLFYYNPNSGVLSIEDPQLGFYLRHMEWRQFIAQCGLALQVNINIEGQLVFLEADRSALTPHKHASYAHVLHLSDLHFTDPTQAEVWSNQLMEDLDEMSISRVDALVLSGDLTQKASELEFKAAQQFVQDLKTRLQLESSQIVLVPGNHDQNWNLSKSAYQLTRREEWTQKLREGSYIAHTDAILDVRVEAAWHQRFSPFAQFFQSIRGDVWSLVPEEQFELMLLPKQRLLFLTLNSAWEIDHHFKARAGLNITAVQRALEHLRKLDNVKDWLKLAVWHHPLLNGHEAAIHDSGIPQQLARAGFRFVLHGHIHRAETSQFRYDMTQDGRRLDLIAAGTFGAPTHDWVPGFPLQYNLLRIGQEEVTVETRRREEPNGAWQPDARWLQGKGKDPLPRYTVPLARSS